MQKVLIPFFILYSLSACNPSYSSDTYVVSTDLNQQPKQQTVETTTTSSDDALYELDKKTESDTNEENHRISLKDFELIIYDFWTLGETLITSDTIEIDNGIGADLHKNLFQILPKNELDKFELSMAIEQNLSVYVGEKVSQDLLDWKKISDFTILNDSADQFFLAPDFKRKEKEEQLNVDFAKIKEQVLALEGEYITKELNQSKHIKELPIELWISRVFLKIKRITESGESSNQILIFNSSWGC